MLLLEGILGLYIRIPVKKDIGQSGNDLLYFGASKLGADPNDEASDSGHEACLLYVSAD
jgi:hypothetical protein